MTDDTLELVRSLRHPDAERVDEVFPAALRDALLDSILTIGRDDSSATDPGLGLGISPLASAQGGVPAPGEAHRQHSHRALIWSAIAVSVAAALVALGLVVAPGPTRPPLAAAAVLKEAAAAAGQAQSAPGPGQYEYIETETRYEMALYVFPAGASTETPVATAYFDETNQAWISATGTGHHVATAGAWQYPSAADEAAWKPHQTALRQSGASDFGEMQTGQPIVDATGLPTDPSQLASVIAQRKLVVNGGVSGGDTLGGRGPSRLEDRLPYSVFEGAAVLLIGPTEGMTPALAKALFQVMASQPGTTSLGTVTAHDGQRGEGVASSAGGSSVDRLMSADRVIVDPTTGRLLQATFAMPSSTTMPKFQSCGPVGQTTTTCVTRPFQSWTAPVWTDVVASGVVNSPTATLPATGTIRPVVTEVPGPPTHVAITDLPGAGSNVHISWTPPADTGTGPVTGYVVHEALANGGNEIHTGGHTTATEYTVRATPTGTFIVQAQNAKGTGPPSAPAKAPPATPTDPAP